jgi:hypothetical protein
MESLRVPASDFPHFALFLEFVARHAYWRFWSSRFPEAARLLTGAASLNPRLTDPTKLPQAMRASDLGRFLEEQRLVGPLAKAPLHRFEQGSLHLVCYGLAAADAGDHNPDNLPRAAQGRSRPQG